jgi:hypothetical protein
MSETGRSAGELFENSHDFGGDARAWLRFSNQRKWQDMHNFAQIGFVRPYSLRGCCPRITVGSDLRSGASRAQSAQWTGKSAWYKANKAKVIPTWVRFSEPGLHNDLDSVISRFRHPTLRRCSPAQKA